MIKIDLRGDRDGGGTRTTYLRLDLRDDGDGGGAGDGFRHPTTASWSSSLDSGDQPVVGVRRGARLGLG